MKTLLEVGFVERVHGLKGELLVRLHFAGSDVLSEVSRLVLTRAGQSQEFRVVLVRGTGKGHIVQLAEVDTRERAEALRGSSVHAHREDMPPLDPGEFYLSDLVGARVVAPDGDVGIVRRIQMHPSVDCLLIEAPDGTELQQPLVEPWLERVDTDAAIVFLTGRDGLIG